MSAPEIVHRAIHVPPGAGRSVWAFSGDRYTLKVGAAETGGLIGVMEGEIPPGSGPPLHIHQNEDEAFYLVEGRLQVVDVDREFIAEPGSFIYLPRGKAHGFKNIFDAPAKMLMLFMPSGFEKFFLEVGAEVVPGQPAPPPSQFAADVERSMRVATEKYGIESD